MTTMCFTCLFTLSQLDPKGFAPTASADILNEGPNTYKKYPGTNLGLDGIALLIPYPVHCKLYCAES